MAATEQPAENAACPLSCPAKNDAASPSSTLRKGKGRPLAGDGEVTWNVPFLKPRAGLSPLKPARYRNSQ